MKKLIYIGLLLLPCLLSGQVDLKWNASLDTNTMLIGQQTRLNLEARFDAASKFSFPTLTDTLHEKVEILNHTLIDTTFDKVNIAEKIVRQQFTVTSFDSGYYVIKPLPLVVNEDTVYTEPLLLSIGGLPVDTADGFKDIKEPEEVPFEVMSWSATYWHWIVIPLVLLAVIIFVAYRLGKKRREAPPVERKPKEPLIDRTLRALQETKKKQLWQNDKTKQYYSEITDTLKAYIEERYSVGAMEATSDELMTSLRSFPLTDTDRQNLLQILRLADLAKFAKEKPIQSENEMCMNYAISFVKNTYREQLDGLA